MRKWGCLPQTRHIDTQKVRGCTFAGSYLVRLTARIQHAQVSEYLNARSELLSTYLRYFQLIVESRRSLAYSQSNLNPTRSMEDIRILLLPPLISEQIAIIEISRDKTTGEIDVGIN